MSMNFPDFPGRGEAFLKALNHPLTAFPFFLGVGAMVVSWVAAPFIGGLGIILPIGAGFAGGGALNGVYRFFRVSQSLDEIRAQTMAKDLAAQDSAKQTGAEQKLAKVEKELQRSIWDTQLAAFAKRVLREVNDLKRAHAAVTDEINNIEEEGKFSLGVRAKIAPLSRNLFAEGASLLFTVVDLMETLRSEDEARIQLEIQELKQGISAFAKKTDARSQEVLNLKTQSLTAKEKRLEELRQINTSIEELLAKTDTCENTLRAVQMDVVRIKVNNSEDAVSEAINRLTECIRSAVAVREQLTLMKGINV